MTVETRYKLLIKTAIKVDDTFATDLCDYCTGGVIWRKRSLMAILFYLQDGCATSKIRGAAANNTGVEIYMEDAPTPEDISRIKRRAQDFVAKDLSHMGKMGPRWISGYELQKIETITSTCEV